MRSYTITEKQVASAVKRVVGGKRGKTCIRRKGRENVYQGKRAGKRVSWEKGGKTCIRRKGRENVYQGKRAGKRVMGVKRGKTCIRGKGREIGNHRKRAGKRVSKEKGGKTRNGRSLVFKLRLQYNPGLKSLGHLRKTHQKAHTLYFVTCKVRKTLVLLF